MKDEDKLTLLELASMAGSFYWLEMWLFRSIGALAQEVDLPALNVHLDAQSRQHAWHAILWEEQIPNIAGKVRYDFTQAPNQQVERVLRLLEQRDLDHVRESASNGMDMIHDDLEQKDLFLAQMLPHSEKITPSESVAGVYRVIIPRLIVSYNILNQRISDVSSASTRRVLRLVLSDELAGWQEGEILIEQVLSKETKETALTMTQFQGLLESSLMDLIGLLGS